MIDLEHFESVDMRAGTVLDVSVKVSTGPAQSKESKPIKPCQTHVFQGVNIILPPAN